jgi:hypothetical protein
MGLTLSVFVCFHKESPDTLPFAEPRRGGSSVNVVYGIVGICVCVVVWYVL